VTNQAARGPLTSRWQLEYRNVHRCLCPSDLWLSDSMPWSSRICPGFGRCPSPCPGEAFGFLPTAPGRWGLGRMILMDELRAGVDRWPSRGPGRAMSLLVSGRSTQVGFHRVARDAEGGGHLQVAAGRQELEDAQLGCGQGLGQRAAGEGSARLGGAHLQGCGDDIPVNGPTAPAPDARSGSWPPCGRERTEPGPPASKGHPCGDDVGEPLGGASWQHARTLQDGEARCQS